MTVDQSLDTFDEKKIIDFLGELSAWMRGFSHAEAKSLDGFLRGLSENMAEFSRGHAESLDNFLRGLAAGRGGFARAKAEKVDRFLQDLARELSELARESGRGYKLTAEKFSSFRYIDLNEEKSSDILRDLLNPAGEHGQGRLFLDAFLELCGLPEGFFPERPYISAERNARTYSIQRPQRSMDILLKGPGTVLAIENKISIGTPDQDLQVNDYLEHLENIAPAEECFCLVYLAPAGKDLPQKSLPREYRERFGRSLKPLVWQKLLDRFSRCQEQVAAPRIRFFLDDFIGAMRDRLTGVEVMT